MPQPPSRQRVARRLRALLIVTGVVLALGVVCSKAPAALEGYTSLLGVAVLGALYYRRGAGRS